MTDQIVVYTKPTCSKCREADKLLKEAGTAYSSINYYTHPIGAEKIRDLLKKMKMAPRDLLRKTEATYKELQLSNSTHSDDEIIELMAKHPELMQRPIIEGGAKAVLGRPTENIREIL